jgi:hypothetical protein
VLPRAPSSAGFLATPGRKKHPVSRLPNCWLRLSSNRLCPGVTPRLPLGDAKARTTSPSSRVPDLFSAGKARSASALAIEAGLRHHSDWLPPLERQPPPKTTQSLRRRPGDVNTRPTARMGIPGSTGGVRRSGSFRGRANDEVLFPIYSCERSRSMNRRSSSSSSRAACCPAAVETAVTMSSSGDRASTVETRRASGPVGGASYRRRDTSRWAGSWVASAGHVSRRARPARVGGERLC